MAMTARVTRQIAIAGKTYSEAVTLEGETQIGKEVLVGPARSGALTVRTDTNTGSLTMAGGHGIATGARLDLYWTVAGVKGSRRGVVAGTVVVNVVPIDLGAGDDLPPATTAIIACVAKEEALLFAGDDLIVMAGGGANLVGDMQIVLAIADGTEQYAAYLDRGEIVSWDSASRFVNPVAGDAIAKLFLSHNVVGVTAKMQFGILLST